MTTLGLYTPGDSVLHRLPAGAKLVLLVAAGVGSVFVASVATVAVAAVVVLSGYAVARVPPRRLARQLRPLLVLLAVIGAFHVVVAGWQRAAVVVGVIGVLVLAAGLVTLTTRTVDLVDALVAALRPLRVVGVRPERVGLLLALSIRSVPVVLGLAAEVRDAQWARGLTSSPRAYAVPLIIRALHHADDLGEALVARGVDDEPR